MKYLVLISFLLPCLANAEKITGLATEYVGEKVRLLKYDDYLSKKTIELASATVGADSTFTLNYEIEETFEVIVEVGNVYGYMYLQPEQDYEIGVPIEDGARTSAHRSIQLAFIELPPKTDVNFLILDLDYRIDGFIGNTFELIADEEWARRLENFEATLTNVYAGINDPFFISYMTFRIASLELVGNPQLEIGMRKQMVYDVYLKNSPVFRENSSYMQLVNSFYKNIFGSILAYHERGLMAAFVTENLDTLKSILSEHAYFKNGPLNELVLIKGLSEVYMSSQYPKSNILNMLKEIKNNAVFEENKKVAANMIKKMTKLVRGYPAPNFKLRSDDGSLVGLEKFRGKFIYLTFFEEWSQESLSEFRIMQKLDERYGEHFEFVSICMGPDSSSLDKFIRKNKEFDWTFLDGYGRPDIQQYYEVVSYPLYYIIDPEGNFYQVPALSPSPKGNYESVDKTMYQINKSLTDRNRSRPPGAPGSLPNGQGG
jgi:peroxiredoxin